jgi:hypothetical protein
VAEPVRIEEELRALPRWLAREYLVEAGGHVVTDSRVEGEGWQATLTPLPPHQVGNLAVGRLLLVLEGDAETITALWHTLEPRLVRAGG